MICANLSGIARASVALAFLATLSACNKAPQTATGPTTAPGAPSKDAPIATVDGTPITRPVFELSTKSLANKPAAELSAEQKTQVVDDLVNSQLLVNQAVKDGLEKDAEVDASLAVARMRLLANAESQKYLKGKEPTDQELRVEYEHALTTMDKTEYHARHILVATKELADQLLAKLKAGAKFEDLAKAQSMDGSKDRGGDLGWFTLSRMVKPFADSVRTLKKGETTATPVQTQFGWHIIKLEDTRETSPPPFEQVKDQLTNRVLQKKLQSYIDELKKTAKIDKAA